MSYNDRSNRGLTIDEQIARRGFARKALSPEQYEDLEKSYDVRVFADGEARRTKNGKRTCEIRNLKS